jgi:hypothetical protein
MRTGDGPLDYAVDGAAPPAELLADPGFAAEHDAAARDCEAIRRGLQLLADGVPPDRQSRPAGGFRPRRRALAAAALAVLALAGGLGSWAALRPDGPGGPGPASLTDRGAVACARLIATGDITAVRPQNGKLLVTLRVLEYLKPSTGPAVQTFTADDPAREVGAPAWTVGRTVLVRVPANGDPPQVFAGAMLTAQREQVRALLDRGVPRCDAPG